MDEIISIILLRRLITLCSLHYYDYLNSHKTIMNFHLLFALKVALYKPLYYIKGILDKLI